MEKTNDKVTSKSRKGKEKVTDGSRKSWVQKEEVALLDALKEMVVGRGEKFGKDSFKSGYLKKLEGMLVLALPGTDIRASPHIASKIKVWKKIYNSVKDMRNTSGFGWNETTKMIEVDSDEVWQDYCKRDSNANGLRFKAFPYYDDWSMIFGNDRATGEMAESAADIAEALEGDVAAGDTAADATEDADRSTTINKQNSGRDPTKKRVKPSEAIVGAMNDFADKIVASMESSNSMLEMLGGRIGYAHDLSAKRTAVNKELERLPITLSERIKVGLAIIKDAQTVDYFFSLKSDDDKMELVQQMLDCGF